MAITKTKFGEIDGNVVQAYTIKNKDLEMTCIDYGCIITGLLAPDEKGKKENVVLGFDTLEEYQKDSPYFGAVIGRNAGRIKDATFELDGVTYQLAKNDGENNLHGGPKGFDKVIWDATIFNEENKIEFTYTSADMEEGYPGELKVKVTYTLTNNTLDITYEAQTSKKTIVNLTNHTYFNLSGDLKEDILNHQLTLKSSQFIELGDDLLPSGSLVDVEGTSFDFRAGRKIIDGTKSDFKQNLLAGSGYDHPFMLDENKDEEIVLEDASSGRKLIIETSEPSVVLYTGNQMDDSFSIRNRQSRKHIGLCLETQGPPDSIHHPKFASAILEKNDVYKSNTTYRFTTIS
ncbi:aldose epimerase family protein [Bacillus solitudinis]|uniref:aldose epimerase family protein n=1 Tax=Bacillus solitudinis TaxID=2014074 RepID=UPI000C23A2F2|nr:aldose epimerase family protein [Bacillus solitudinis]